MFPVFTAFIALSVWLLWRSGRARAHMGPFWLALASGVVSVTSFWLAVVGIVPAIWWWPNAGMGILVAASAWSLLQARRAPVASTTWCARRRCARRDRRCRDAWRTARRSPSPRRRRSTACTSPWTRSCQGRRGADRLLRHQCLQGPNRLCHRAQRLRASTVARVRAFCASRRVIARHGGGVPLKDSPADPARKSDSIAGRRQERPRMSRPFCFRQREPYSGGRARLYSEPDIPTTETGADHEKEPIGAVKGLLRHPSSSWRSRRSRRRRRRLTMLTRSRA